MLKIARKDIDLMAPAGSYETMLAAIQGGADSIYFGMGKLNMRARSAFNFSETDLKAIVRYCKSFNKRTYLALNVVVYDDEILKVHRMIDLAGEIGVDAVIAADQAVINYCRSAGMEVHASTQLNISNLETLKFYAAFADVVVLARELDLEKVSDIADQIRKKKITGPSGKPVRLEMFVHGALCMSVSGKCYLSLHQHNKSANRGECLQDCRRTYTVREKETGIELDIENEYILSPKDLCTINFLDKILAAGVSVLKIEGRARSPEYVKTVTSCYNEALLSMEEGSFTPEKTAAWTERLNAVFNRGFWEGYYLGRKMGEWSDVHGSKASKRKYYVARSLNYYHKLNVGEFLCEAGSVGVGDEILVIGPNTGVIETRISEIHNDTGSVREVFPGERFSIALPRKIRRADRLYKLVKI